MISDLGLAHAILTLSVPILVILWYKWTFSYSKNGRPPLPPGPYGLPLVGYFPFLGSNLHERFTEMAQRYGPIFSLRLGSKLHVVVNSTDLATAMVRDQDQIFANRSPPLAALAFAYGGIDIAWSNNNTNWRNMRKLLVSQVLSHANLIACQSFRTSEVTKMVNRVYAKMGTKMNVNEIAFNTELNVVTSMLWGARDCVCSDAEFRELQFKMVELIGAPNISDFIPMVAWLDLQGMQRKIKSQRENLDRIFDDVIEGRIKANSSKTEGDVWADGRKDFLQILLELKEQNDGSTSFSLNHIKALLMDVVLGAVDTTATMAEWVMAEIMHNPGVMRRVQDELMEVVGESMVNESHLNKLNYLEAVIKETFRVHPPAPFLLPRCPDESCTVGGYTIPNGTIVYINAWAIHRDPENWEDPLEFKPERFLDGKWDYNGNNLKYISFGSGRRLCPGITLGNKMLKYLIATLLHCFEWRVPEDEELELSDEFGITTKKRKPLIAIPFKRQFDKSVGL